MSEPKLPDVVRELIVATLAAALVGIVYLVIEKMTARSWIAILAALAAATIIIFLLMLAWVRGSARSYKSKLHLLGIEDILVDYRKCPTVSELLVQATTSVDFLGISGRTFFEVVGIEDAVKRRTREGVQFRFLFLDPASPHLGPRAEAEQTSPEAWKADITASIARLKGIQKDVGSQRLSVRTYNAPPTWRAFFLDRRTAYVNYYALEHGGRDTPVMRITNHQGSLFHPLHEQFNEFWENGTQQ